MLRRERPQESHLLEPRVPARAPNYMAVMLNVVLHPPPPLLALILSIAIWPKVVRPDMRSLPYILICRNILSTTCVPNLHITSWPHAGFWARWPFVSLCDSRRAVSRCSTLSMAGGDYRSKTSGNQQGWPKASMGRPRPGSWEDCFVVHYTPEPARPCEEVGVVAHANPHAASACSADSDPSMNDPSLP